MNSSNLFRCGNLFRFCGDGRCRSQLLTALAFSLAMLCVRCQADETTPPQTASSEIDSQNPYLSVVLFTPRDRDDHFWKLFVSFMNEAALDLNIKLEIKHAGGSRRMMTSQIREVCWREDKPDAIVFQSFKRGGPAFLKIADRNQVPAMLINAGLNQEQAESLGHPRSKLSYWIGEILPNDFGAGFQLANALIDEALKTPSLLADDGKVHVIGINGVVSDTASVERMSGLTQAIKRRKGQATLHQVVSADWDLGLARKRCRVLHRRHPQAKVIWTASDPMAMGAMKAIQDRGLKPGHDVIIGGVDATPEAMDMIEEGRLFATVGGHVMDGGWATVLLNDYLRGIELNRIPRHYLSPMKLITSDNVQQYRLVFEQATWKKADFRKYSLHSRSQADQSTSDQYDFDMLRLVDGLNKNRNPVSSSD
jgi:ABC-type sugar transport system substrate-binding protein